MIKLTLVRQYRCLLLLALACGSAEADQNLCAPLLANGVFEKTSLHGAWDNYSRVKTLYCSSQSSTLASAKNIGASATVPIDDILVTFGFQDDESGYQKFQSALCDSKDSLASMKGWSSTELTKVSTVLAEEYVECIKAIAKGTVAQSATDLDRDSNRFSWNIAYNPAGNIKATINPSTNGSIICKDPKTHKVVDGQSFKVDASGRTFSCERQACDAAILVLNSDIYAIDPTVNIQAIRAIPASTVQFTHNEVVTTNNGLKGQFQLPVPNTDPDEYCIVISGYGNWSCHINNFGDDQCPRNCWGDEFLHVSADHNIVVSNNFDSIYTDNAGVCHYNVTCKKPSPPSDAVPLPAYCKSDGIGP